MAALEPEKTRLCHLLEIASHKLAAVEGPIRSPHNSGHEIAEFIVRCRERICEGTITPEEKQELWGIFAPTCDWDEVGDDASVGEEIFQLLDKLYGPSLDFARTAKNINPYEPPQERCGPPGWNTGDYFALVILPALIALLALIIFIA